MERVTLKTNSKYVLFDENVIHKIITELKDNPNNETGGVLLGYRNDKVWNVVEMVEPGPNSIRKVDSFEFDTEYVNQVCNEYVQKVGMQIEFLGIWHKHIGRNPFFSKEDMEFNKHIIETNNIEIISGIITTYPVYRMNLYYVDSDGNDAELMHNLNTFIFKKGGSCMKVIMESTKRDVQLATQYDMNCGCDYCECSCDTDTLLPEDGK